MTAAVLQMQSLLLLLLLLQYLTSHDCMLLPAIVLCIVFSSAAD